MNQILMTNEKNGAQKESVKPVIKFFILVIIVFALVLVGQGGYNLYKSMNENVEYIKPVLSYEVNGTAINLKIVGETGINKIEYAWNDSNKTVLKANGKNDVDIELEIPQGENELKITVIDVQGNNTSFVQKGIAFTDATDIVKPKISIVKSESKGKINIIVTDETELALVSYQWEGEEAVEVELTEETKKEITKEIGVQKGTKKLIVTATDKTGNKETMTMNIVGSNGPQIKVTLSDGNFVVKVTDENIISKIEYTHNEKVYTVENIPQGATEFEFKVKLEEGANYLKINAYENDLMTEYKCKKTR